MVKVVAFGVDCGENIIFFYLNDLIFNLGGLRHKNNQIF